jgi:hypothetical protein
VTGGEAAMQRKAIAAMMNDAAGLTALFHIISSLLCGEQKSQNS